MPAPVTTPAAAPPRAPDAPARTTVQGTSVAIAGIGLLITGAPGIGKSDLALRLIDAGALLIADDLTEITRQDRLLMARLPAGAPAETRGRLEVRGIGLLPVPMVEQAPLRLMVALKPQQEIERLPEPERWTCLGIELPAVSIDPRTASAAAKLRLVVRGLPGFIMPPP